MNDDNGRERALLALLLLLVAVPFLLALKLVEALKGRP